MSSLGRGDPTGVDGDDAVGAELLGGQDAQQTDRAVADDSDGLTGAGFGGNSSEPTGAEHIRSGEQALGLLGGGFAVDLHQGAVGPGDAGVLGLGADGTHHHLVDAAGLEAGLADLAGVVGGDEGADHEVADLDVAHVVADFFDHADVSWPMAEGPCTSSAPR